MTTLASHELKDVEALVGEHYGLHGELSTLYGYSDHNYLLTSQHTKYVVKVSSHTEPANLLHIQNIILADLEQHPLEEHCAFPILVPSAEG